MILSDWNGIFSILLRGCELPATSNDSAPEYDSALENDSAPEYDSASKYVFVRKYEFFERRMETSMDEGLYLWMSKRVW